MIKVRWYSDNYYVVLAKSQFEHNVNCYVPMVCYKINS